MEIKIINPIEDPRWDQFVCNHEHGSIYHHSAWMDAIKRTYNYIPKCYILENAEDKIQSALASFLIKSGVTGNRLVSLPFSPFCDLLTTDHHSTGILLDFIKKKVKGHGFSFLEIKTFMNFEIFRRNGFQKVDHYKLHVLPLNSNIEKIRKCFHKSCIQRSIRKAEKTGVMIRRGETEEDLRTFYRLYVLTRRKHGLIPHRYLFFKNIWNLFEPKDLMEFLLAEYQGRTIAGTMLFKFRDSYYYHFAVSDKEFLRFRPNHLLLWVAIKEAHEEGYKYFNFGRSAADQTGLVSFKRRWGTREYDLPYFYYPKVRGIEALGKESLAFRFAARIVKGSPTYLLKIGSKLFCKYLG